MITVGMNYDIRPGKEATFEQVFGKVLAVMQDMDGHEHTALYHAVTEPRKYLVISQWNDRRAFEAFTKSDRFRSVVDWGKEQVLASMPKHEVYGDVNPITKPAPTACPMHA